VLEFPPSPRTVVDVRTLPPGTCRERIEAAFDALAAGEALELFVPHDPSPLQARFAGLRPGRSTWTYLVAGPEVWHVRVAKSA
jgi:uncharacterized protein (DUF2249 family)